MAAKYGHLEVVKLLLQDNRVDPSAFFNYSNDEVKILSHT